ncbi:helix-turn-helix transcriptional regulator [Streptomyces clavuligerus]|nr:helix-turn-helix transcriptional regulator [Streptomyces clavuligerus]WDN56944.1 helix-turn-helix domain-containing protein [Streptomyces clavuligerus]
MPDRIFDGNKLRDYRVIRRMSQSDLAAALDIRTNAVYRWENGLATPPQERLPGIAAMLGADLDELFPRPAPPNLADLRCDAGMRQSDTTRYTNSMSPMPIRAAEQGRRALSDEAVTALARAYNVTRAELLAAQRRSFGFDQPAVPEQTAPTAPTALVAQGARARRGDHPSAGTRVEPGRQEQAGRQSKEMPAQAATTIAEKIAYLRAELHGGTGPSDADLAVAGNGRGGPAVLTERLVRELRTGRRTTAPDGVLDALALAFDVPPVYFRSSDPGVHRLVVSARAVHNEFTIMAARGGEQEISREARDQLRDFISDTMAEILGTGEDEPRTP